MNACVVKLDDEELEYNGEYLEEGNELNLVVENHYSKGNIGTTDVQHKGILIEDLKKHTAYYSPNFTFSGFNVGLSYFEKYKANFYFKTKDFSVVSDLNNGIKIKAIAFYHPMLIHFFCNPAFSITNNDDTISFTLQTKNQNKTVLPVCSNNIKEVEYGGVYNLNDSNSHQTINLETENYIKLNFIDEVDYKEILSYVHEFNLFINVYIPLGLLSYKTVIFTNNSCFELIHKKLSDKKYYNGEVLYPIRQNFFDFFCELYKSFSYRNETNKNQLIPLEFKPLSSLEDEFLFYFRYIDMYMGNTLQRQGGDGGKVKNHKRIGAFIEQYARVFEKPDIASPEVLKNEINSLRAHYVHEGYYLQNGEFKVTGEKGQRLYNKKLDYRWLYRIVKALKYGVYLILYEKILKLDIDEKVIKHYCENSII